MFRVHIPLAMSCNLILVHYLLFDVFTQVSRERGKMYKKTLWTHNLNGCFLYHIAHILCIYDACDYTFQVFFILFH